jgi:hypothetical protein
VSAVQSRVRFRKLGVLVPGPPRSPWVVSHASVPIVSRERDGSLGLLFSSRDLHGRSHVVGAGLELERGEVGYQPQPLLSPGALGAFDDSGAMASSLVQRDSTDYLYYIGWSLGVTVPFYTYVGCAVRDAGADAFTRVSDAPILGRVASEPYFTTAPWVMVENGTWRMWYATATDWSAAEGQPLHRYHIRYAESDDGLVWRRDGVVCIDYADADEYALTRPCVIREGDTYLMWYSRRGSTYRIGYAESHDGLSWIRKDHEVGIDVSRGGWDSDMIEYPFVFQHEGRRYLLYNGNGYGETGIGWAVDDSSTASVDDRRVD